MFRYRLLRLSSVFLVNFLRAEIDIPAADIIEGLLPADTHIIAVKLDLDPPPGVLILTLESEQFSPVEDGEAIPEITPQYRTRG